jgi:mannose-1-phosphate guanylyltransferase
MAENKRAAVILAGGSGTRFWPVSQNNQPKQYLPLFGKRTLIQQTWDRAKRLCKQKDVFICSAASQKKFLKKQVPAATLFLEPAARNTGAAVLFSMLALKKRGYSNDTLVAVFPADHYIADDGAFDQVLETAFRAARETSGLITLGIVPRSAHTGYGYIEAGLALRNGAHHASRFVEKPEKEKAEAFLRSGKFFWNGGVFIWKLGAILNAFEQFAPSERKILEKAKTTKALERVYKNLPSVPVDKMILEKSNEVYMVPADMGWSDVGSWNTLYELKTPDSHLNYIESTKTAAIDANGCLVLAKGKTVSLIGVKDLIIIAEGDSLLICPRDQDQLVKKAVEQLLE